MTSEPRMVEVMPTQITMLTGHSIRYVSHQTKLPSSLKVQVKRENKRSCQINSVYLIRGIMVLRMRLEANGWSPYEDSCCWDVYFPRHTNIEIISIFIHKLN